MRKLLLVLLGMVAGLSISDVARAAPFDWTGFYVGGNVGYSWGRWDSSSNDAIFAGGAQTASPAVNGWLGGVQAGYNWQHGGWLVGFEGDIQATGERAHQNGALSATGPCNLEFCDGGTLTISQVTSDQWKFPWFATMRARGGAVFGDWLLYGTGGLAVGEATFATSSILTVTTTVPATVTTAAFAQSESVTKAGWTLGAGVEKAFAPHWTAKLEYLHVDLGSHVFFANSGFDTNVRIRDDIVRLGLNYQIRP